MAKLAVGQKKSKIKRSIECCRLNLKPSNFLPCNAFHNFFSAGVELLALSVKIAKRGLFVSFAICQLMSA